MPPNRNGRFLKVYSRDLLRQEAYGILDAGEREEEVRKQWGEFLAKDLPRIDAALKEEAWIRGESRA